MMHLWRTTKLADDIALGRVTSNERVAYFVFAQVLFVAIGYIAGYGPSHHSWLYVYEAVVVCVVTFAGARRVAATYSIPIDAGFFEATFLLSVPLTIKMTAAMWIADYGGWWALDVILQRLSVETAESARAYSYWFSRAYDLLPFVVAVIIAVVFWLRLTHHIAYVVSKRGA
jgi:hypothetical protein